jgi:hypothetical protein
MTYSVWDHAARRYDYYQTPNNDTAAHAPKPKHLRGGNKLGLTPDQAAWPLPAGAMRTGSGKYPKGMIASRGGGKGLGQILGLDFTPTNILILGALGYMVWKFVWKPATR